MRVVAGSAKRKRLKTLEGTEVTRPTSDRVKEAVFGAIQFQIAGKRFLDLFAGSGAMGIEALSRGAKQAAFIEKDPKAIAIIKENLKATNLSQDAIVLQQDFLENCKQLGTFDLIYMDPPYRSGIYQKAVDIILKNNMLAKDGLLLIEHDGTEVFDKLAIWKIKKYGKAYVTFAKLMDEGVYDPSDTRQL